MQTKKKDRDMLLPKEELLKSREYWVSELQLKLFELLDQYMIKNDLRKVDIANQLGFSRGYISQILNGDTNISLKKMVDLTLMMGKVPKLEFLQLEDEVNRIFREQSTPVIPISASPDNSITVEIEVGYGQG